MDMGGGYGRGQDPAMETGGNSQGGTAARPGVPATMQAREAAQKYIFLGEAHGEWQSQGSDLSQLPLLTVGSE